MYAKASKFHIYLSLTTIFYSKKGEKTTPKSEFEWSPDNVQTIIDGVTLLSQYTVREKISPPQSCLGVQQETEHRLK